MLFAITDARDSTVSSACLVSKLLLQRLARRQAYIVGAFALAKNDGDVIEKHSDFVQ